MTSHLKRTEVLFCDMHARRMLRFKKDAAAKGEQYVDLSKPTVLECGVSVRVRYEPVEGKPEPRAFIEFQDRTKTLEFLREVATEILAGRVLDPTPVLKDHGKLIEFAQALT
jgi:hypothetical protein